ncbi:hypothetical protein ZIOFF_053308 [Zingiber officinale]|uniref:Uncharacterized protein n=1 Tax=Zingiber officinale TaxID=94328 RepID=A0A8J5FG37_ZINOF|nr:hypothetical protein ZIOFF_053308 [Zingiber officinale]
MSRKHGNHPNLLHGPIRPCELPPLRLRLDLASPTLIRPRRSIRRPQFLSPFRSDFSRTPSQFEGKSRVPLSSASHRDSWGVSIPYSLSLGAVYRLGFAVIVVRWRIRVFLA